MTNSNSRQFEYPVDPLFLDRWSPRAFDGNAIPREHLLTILDAAHWAPSVSNLQPWRFVYAHRDSEDWSLFVEFLLEGNQHWVKNASVLLFVVSRSYNVSRESEKNLPRPIPSMPAQHGFHRHAGTSAWSPRPWYGGILKDKIVEAPNIPAGYKVEAGIAIGTLTDKSVLPDDLAEREVPSKRLPLSDVVLEGRFTGKAD